MFVAKTIPAEHKDLIHDVAYDFHGRRMATCSSDQHMKVWDFVDGEWKCTSSLKIHVGSVWRVTWAHPEFGQVIATCSFDRTTAVWEELPSEAGEAGQWVKRGNLVDSRGSVTDVKFAPKHLGLQLATCSTDGNLRIYEAPDVMNLSQWPLQHDIPTKLTCSCLSWSPSRAHPPMIAVGSDDPNPAAGGKVHIFEHSDSTRKWHRVETILTVTDPVRDVAFSPNLGRSYHLLAIASKDVTVIKLKPLPSSKKDQLSSSSASQVNVTRYEVQQVAQFNDHHSPVWRLSWNITGTVLASSGDDGCVRLWKANYLDTWRCIATLKGDGSTAQGSSEKTQSNATSSVMSGSPSQQGRYARFSAMS